MKKMNDNKQRIIDLINDLEIDTMIPADKKIIISKLFNYHAQDGFLLHNDAISYLTRWSDSEIDKINQLITKELRREKIMQLHELVMIQDIPENTRKEISDLFDSLLDATTRLYCNTCGERFHTELTEDEYGVKHGNLNCHGCRNEVYGIKPEKVKMIQDYLNEEDGKK